MNLIEIVSTIFSGTAVAIIIFLIKTATESKKSLEEAANLLTTRVSNLETKIEIFWRNVSFDAAKILHTPHPENSRRDFLIIRWENKNIGLVELHELISVFKEIIPDEKREMAERNAASLFLRALEAEYNLLSEPMVNIDGSMREIPMAEQAISAENKPIEKVTVEGENLTVQSDKKE